MPDNVSGPHQVMAPSEQVNGGAGLTFVAAAVAMALVAGLIFAYAAAVMPNLAAADDRTFVAIAQRDMDNPIFPLTFTAAMIFVVAAVVVDRLRRPSPAAGRWMLAALVLYGLAFAITMVVHVPLNDEIAQAGDPARIADVAQVREDFEGPWVVWNLVRAVLAIGGVAALARATLLHGAAARAGAHGRRWSQGRIAGS